MQIHHVRKRVFGAGDVFRDRYGFPAEYRPLNDIQVEGRKLVPASLKIEGGAMTLRIVVNVKPIDTELAGKAMPMPPEKVRDKALKTLESRFTWLEREAGREIDEEELTAFAVACTERAFGESGLKRAILGAVERDYADAFRAELDTEAWLFGKSERYRFANLLRPGDMLGRGREKAMGGMIRATLAVRDGIVLDSIVNGDWHPRPLESIDWLERALAGVAAEPDSLRHAVEAFLSRNDVEFAGIAVDDLMTAFEASLADCKPWDGRL